METNVNYKIVGVFVIVLIGAIVFSIIWLSSGFSLAQYSTYMVYMQESVTGLNIDSPVEYNGVDVGVIKSIAINPKNPRLVELLLNIKDNTPITFGTVATLDTKGLTGLTYIQLKDKGTNLKPLLKGPNDPYPVIKTAPSIFVRLDTTLTQLTTSLHQITASFQSVLDPENQQSIKETLQNLRVVTSALANNSQKLNSILTNTAQASQQFAPLLQSSNHAVKIFETQTLPIAYQLLNNLDNVTRTLSSVSIEIKQNPSVLIRGAAIPTLGPGETK